MWSYTPGSLEIEVEVINKIVFCNHNLWLYKQGGFKIIFAKMEGLLMERQLD